MADQNTTLRLSTSASARSRDAGAPGQAVDPGASAALPYRLACRQAAPLMAADTPALDYLIVEVSPTALSPAPGPLPPLQLCVKIARGVRMTSADGADARLTAGKAEIDLHDAGGDGIVTTFWALDLAAHPSGAFRVAEVVLLSADPAVGATVRQDVVKTFTADAAARSAALDHTVVAEVKLAHAAQAVRALLRRAEQGGIAPDEAADQLGKAHETLLRFGDQAAAARIERAILGIQGGESPDAALHAALTGGEVGAVPVSS